MDYIQDILHLNKEIIPKSFMLTIKNIKAALLSIPYILLYAALSVVAGNTGLFAGIIMAVATGLIASDYLYVVEMIIRYGHFDLEDIKKGFTVYLRPVYMIIFAVYVVQLGLGLFLGPLMRIIIMGYSFSAILYFVAILVFNTIPEVIYIKGYQMGDMFTYSLEFIKENWLQWLLPNIIFMYIMYIAFRNMVSSIFLASYGGNSVILVIMAIIIMLVVQVVLLFAMIYRGNLFKLLDGSSMRKRNFKRNMYR